MWRGGRCSPLLGAALLALLVPGGAAAATVVNGDFESGSLSGWHVREVTGAGSWFAYKGTEPPIGRHRGAAPVQAPPQGVFAGIADQANPNTLILYQDVALETGFDHRLSLLAYYDTYEPIAVPTPDTLSVDDEVLQGQKNQQYRIDVIKLAAPIASLDPSDILRTLFQTTPGDPSKMSPTRLTANLSPYAGQTVRLRIATAVHEEVLNAGVDAVSISSTAPGRSPSRRSDRISFGKAKAIRRSGVVILPVRVPDPGTLIAKGKSIKPATVKVARAGTVRMRLKPTPSARRVLKQKYKLRSRVTVAYRQDGGSVEAASRSIVFKFETPARKQH
jgi:hypothetical protein